MSEHVELDALLDELREKAGSAVDEAASTGTPAELKLAAAIEQQAEAMEGLHEELKSLHNSIDRINSMSSELEMSGRRASDAVKSAAKNAAGEYIRDYGQVLDYLDGEAGKLGSRIDSVCGEVGKAGDDAVHAIKQASIKASQEIGKAGKDASGAIGRQAKRSATIIALLSVVGGILAMFGAFWLFQVNPGIQKFVKSYGGGTLLIVVIALALVVYLVVCAVHGRKKRW